MIGYLRGRVIERNEETIVVDVGGVGYELTCSLNTLAAIVDGEEVELRVQTQMREDALQLFGFATSLEKRMFNSLLKVNGVGPKLAIKILSGASIEELARMIEAGDVKALAKLPKVGKKTAEQLVLALRGKLSIEPTGTPKTARSSSRLSSVSEMRFTGVRADVLSALVNLGFRLQDAESVVEQLPEDIALEQGVREGLRMLAGTA